MGWQRALSYAFKLTLRINATRRRVVTVAGPRNYASRIDLLVRCTY
jgi:hypothetical protein